MWGGVEGQILMMIEHFRGLVLIVETFDQALTSAIFEAQVGKSPNVTQSNNFPNYCQNELHLVGPLASLMTLCRFIIQTVAICHQIIFWIACWLHLDIQLLGNNDRVF